MSSVLTESWGGCSITGPPAPCDATAAPCMVPLSPCDVTQPLCLSPAAAEPRELQPDGDEIILGRMRWCDVRNAGPGWAQRFPDVTQGGSWCGHTAWDGCGAWKDNDEWTDWKILICKRGKKKKWGKSSCSQGSLLLTAFCPPLVQTEITSLSEHGSLRKSGLTQQCLEQRIYLHPMHWMVFLYRNTNPINPFGIKAVQPTLNTLSKFREPCLHPVLKSVLLQPIQQGQRDLGKAGPGITSPTHPPVPAHCSTAK